MTITLDHCKVADPGTALTLPTSALVSGDHAVDLVFFFVLEGLWRANSLRSTNAGSVFTTIPRFFGDHVPPRLTTAQFSLRPRRGQ